MYYPRDGEVIIYRPIEPDEFIEDAKELQAAIRSTKIKEKDALQVKKVWEVDMPDFGWVWGVSGCFGY